MRAARALFDGVLSNVWTEAGQHSTAFAPFGQPRERRGIPKDWKGSGPGAGRSVCSVLEVCETMFLAAQNQKFDPEHKTIRIELKLYVSHVHSGRPSRTYPGKEFGLGILLDWRAVFAAPALCFCWLRDFGNQANPLSASAPWFGSFLK